MRKHLEASLPQKWKSRVDDNTRAVCLVRKLKLLLGYALRGQFCLSVCQGSLASCFRELTTKYLGRPKL